MDNRWEQKLRDKMSEYSQPEPEGLWEGIMRQMETAGKDNPVRTVTRKRRVLTLILGTGAVAAAIAAFIFIKGDGISSVHDGRKAAVLVADIADFQRFENVVPPAPVHLYPRRPETSSAGSNTSGQFSQVTGSTGNAVQDGGSGMPSHAGQAADSDSGSRKPQSVTEMSEALTQDPVFEELPGRRRPVKGQRFSTSLSVSNLTGSRQSLDGYSAMQPTTAAFKGIPAANAFAAHSDQSSMILNKDSRSDTEIRHRQPVRAGISFRYHLTDRWALETGLVYSFLASEMKTGNTAAYASSTDQTLHYIGIPLKASFSILDKKYLTVYASAGGMMEKCVSGKAVTGYSMDGHELSRSEDRLEIKPLQWSASAEAGIQGNITGYLGIYIEPGISWHFDNGSRISTIYSEKPLNFNLEFGVRFSFD